MSSLSAGALPLAANQSNRLTILYGSQTGNGAEVATELEYRARGLGFAAQAVSLADYKSAALKREGLLTLIVSTHGEGDPPDDAELFHEYLMSDTAPRLEHLRYSVLALGDSSYVNFCQTGREFDAQLAALGAKRFESLVECDLDFDEPATAWSDRITAALPDLLDATATPPQLRAVPTTTVYDKRNPFPAEVLVNQKITSRDSDKDVRHIELSLTGSGIDYQPGDSLAVIAENPPALIAQLLETLELDGDRSVDLNGATMSLHTALQVEREITSLNVGFLRNWAATSGSRELHDIVDGSDKEALADMLENQQIIDIVSRFPASIDAQSFVDVLRKMSPRSYSIASSLAANPDEVHLTVAAVQYQAFGLPHWGAASTYLADRLPVGATVSVYLEKNARFRLPEENVPIILIGPGTGVAPFRAFLEERVEQGATGANWLFFGDRHLESDFLYQLEWQRYLASGALHRLSAAFSRDQREKIYVQNRLAEESADVYRWMQRGAAIYVCGDAKSMAGDVHDALINVLVTEGGLTTANAEQHLKDMRREGRYQRDVY